MNSGIIIDDSNVITGVTSLTVDNININGNTISSTAGTDLLITPLSGQQIVLDGTIIIDAGVITAATSITSTEFVGGGVGLTALNGTQVTSGTLPVARIGADSIVEGKLNVSNGPTNGQVLTARDGVAGGFTWETASGGAALSGSTNNTVVTVTGADAMIGEANLVFTGTNLGIGVSDPDQLLEVKSDTATGGHNAYININHTGSAGGYQSGIYFKASDVNCYKIDVTGNGDMSWRQGASETVQLALDNNGKLGISVAEPEFQLHVKYGGTDSGASFHARNSLVVERSNETGIAIGTRNSDSGFLDFAAPQSSYDGRIQYSQGGRYMNFYTSAAVEFIIQSNGDIHDSSGAIHSNSDERIKENIVDSAFGLAEVLQLRPVDFNFCSWYTNEEVNSLRTGFIAQEVKEIIPNVIKIKPHETPFDFTDPDGTPHHLHDPIPDIHSIQDQQLIPMLVKAIQELKAEIDLLKV